jgi:hypothetical protein
MKALPLVILAVLIVGCTQTSGNNNVNAGLNGPIDESTATQSDMLSLCLAFMNPTQMTMCAAAFGTNSSLCNELSGDDYTHCAIYAAAARKNVSVCASMNAYVPDDCYTTVAMASLDNSLCVNASSPSGCDYMVNITRASKTVEECKRRTGDYETDCVFNYAKKLNDSSICNKSTTLMGFQIACKAMISGDVESCRNNGLDVTEWYYCATKALYPKVMPTPGVFNPDLCEDNNDCMYYVLRAMINYAASK